MNKISTKNYGFKYLNIWLQVRNRGRGIQIRRVLVDYRNFPTAVSPWETYFPKKGERQRVVMAVATRDCWASVRFKGISNRPSSPLTEEEDWNWGC